MYKHIAVAVNGSETSYVALKEATTLAKAQKADLCLIHIVDNLTDKAFKLDIPEYKKALLQEDRDKLNKMLAMAKTAGVNAIGHLTEMDTLQERISEKILEEAQQWHADLLVIGTHGRRGFSRLFLGSVAEAIIRMASIPVLLIRAKAT